MLSRGSKSLSHCGFSFVEDYISHEEVRVVEVKGVVDTGVTPLGCRHRVGCSVEGGKCTIQDDKMKIWLPKNQEELKEYLRDPLYKNSFFIMLTSISNAGFGFFFWMLAAKLYPKEDVGIATALISSMALLVLLSRLGLDQSLIRFFPERDKNSVFGTSAVIRTDNKYFSLAS